MLVINKRAKKEKVILNLVESINLVMKITNDRDSIHNHEDLISIKNKIVESLERVRRI